MNKPNNVIDLNARRKRNSGSKKGSTEAAPVVDMTARRNEILTHERRQVKRTILSEFVGAFIVIPKKGLQRVSIYDISEEGIAFDLPAEAGQLVPGEEIAMRVYLNQQTYFPFVVKIRNARAIVEEGINRSGANFVKGTVNDVALHHFVKFIETVSASLQTDHGDIMVSNLRT